MSAIPTPTLRSRSVPLASVAAALVLAPATVGAQSPDRIDLPPAWQGEGITTDGSSLYAGSLADGAVYRANLRTGDGEVSISGQSGLLAVGLSNVARRYSQARLGDEMGLLISRDVLEHAARYYEGLECAPEGCTVEVNSEIPHYNVDNMQQLQRKYKEKGVNVHESTPEELAQFQAEMKPVHEWWLGKVPDGKKYIDFISENH